MMNRLLILGLLGSLTAWCAQAQDLSALLRERLAAVVAVEFSIEQELDRNVNVAFGVVVDNEGTIILEGNAISARATPSQLVDWRVYRPNAPTISYSTAEYLGQDTFTGWHFVRVAEDGREGLRPITDFAHEQSTRTPALAESVWGIGLRMKEENFRPYFLASRVSMTQAMPQLTGIALGDVAGRGLPVFDEQGAFLGLGASGFGQSFVIYSSRRRGGDPSLLVNPDECAAFRLAADVLPYLNRIPENPYGRPIPWFGVDGIDPVDPEVAEFLGLGGNVGLVVSEVLAGSPAEQGGLLPRDIIVALDEVPLPRLKPDQVVVGHLQREISRRAPGTDVLLTVLRDKVELSLPVTLADAPKTPAEADRRYYEDLGMTIREMVYADAVSRRSDALNLTGVVAHFVNPSSAVSTAGLRYDDWIQSIDGRAVENYADAISILDEVADSGRQEFVLQVSRGGQTSILRVNLN